MNQQDVASLYSEISASVANPVGGVLKLYDRILEDFRRASLAIRSGNIERRVDCLNHALLVVAELEGVLDFEKGGDVARHLKGFYRVVRGLILQANIRANEQGLEELATLVAPVRDAWQQVERDFGQNKVTPPEQSASSSQKAPSASRGQAVSVSLESEPGPSGSRWSA